MEDDLGLEQGEVSGDSYARASTNGNVEMSIADMLRQEWATLADDETTFIPVPGYEKISLAVKYGLPEKGRDLNTIAENVQREFKKDTYEASFWTIVDTMIELCQGLYVMPPGYHDWVEYDPNEDGRPVQFDERLEKAMGWPEVGEVRKIVVKLFGGRKHDSMLMNHGERLTRWLNDTKADLTKEFWQTGG